MVFIYPTDANVIQAGKVIPGTIIQPEMATQYTSQLFGSLNNHPKQNPQLGLWEELRKVESRTLGAVQIIIGLIHIGFGSVSTVLWDAYPHYTPLATYGAYPFWGGIFFIASGSLSVSAEKLWNTCLTLAAQSRSGATAPARGEPGHSTSHPGRSRRLGGGRSNVALHRRGGERGKLTGALAMSLGFGLGLILLVFSLLEFCITTSTAHFGCQAACCTNDMTVVVVPYTLIRNGEIPAEDTPAEAHDNVAFCP
uniref:membrane-spanning 4-domains subfamily A member 15-like n=1 Tax=Euleptes europaea TaxID=460621 RepID=UPI00254061B1|nr:membrane-spanning 4-domains subfamily A member 15-like [Euleptes europaea]